jgi:hypothetical protein
MWKLYNTLGQQDRDIRDLMIIVIGKDGKNGLRSRMASAERSIRKAMAYISAQSGDYHLEDSGNPENE